ncbi:MAG: hypothetical protein KAX39_01030, partial [candidate division Zixibacteria bacterium]|nr:hypothetical protein [candidate division Zixibacteria bacterium]
KEEKMSGMSITQYFFPGQVKNSASGRKEIYGHRNKERAKTALDDAYALIRGGVILLRKARTPSLSGLPENSNDIVKGFLITETRLGRCAQSTPNKTGNTASPKLQRES